MLPSKEKIMETIKKEFEALKLGKITYIAAAAVLVLAIVLAIVAPNTEGYLRAWQTCPWLSYLLGVLALGEGIVLYAHTIVVKGSNLGNYLGIAGIVLGVFWLVTDIIANSITAWWWLGLIIAIVVGVLCYFVPGLVEKYILKK